MIKLRLYVVGNTPEALDTVDNLHKFFQDEWQQEYSLEVIDVMDNPDLAEQDLIIATPTLVKISPEPVLKIIGDLSMKDKVLKALDLKKA